MTIHANQTFEDTEITSDDGAIEFENCTFTNCTIKGNDAIEEGEHIVQLSEYADKFTRTAYSLDDIATVKGSGVCSERKVYSDTSGMDVEFRKCAFIGKVEFKGLFSNINVVECTGTEFIITHRKEYSSNTKFLKEYERKASSNFIVQIDTDYNETESTGNLMSYVFRLGLHPDFINNTFIPYLKTMLQSPLSGEQYFDEFIQAILAPKLLNINEFSLRMRRVHYLHGGVLSESLDDLFDETQTPGTGFGSGAINDGYGYGYLHKNSFVYGDIENKYFPTNFDVLNTDLIELIQDKRSKAFQTGITATVTREELENITGTSDDTVIDAIEESVTLFLENANFTEEMFGYILFFKLQNAYNWTSGNLPTPTGPTFFVETAMNQVFLESELMQRNIRDNFNMLHMMSCSFDDVIIDGDSWTSCTIESSTMNRLCINDFKASDVRYQYAQNNADYLENRQNPVLRGLPFIPRYSIVNNPTSIIQFDDVTVNTVFCANTLVDSFIVKNSTLPAIQPYTHQDLNAPFSITTDYFDIVSYDSEITEYTDPTVLGIDCLKLVVENSTMNAIDVVTEDIYVSRLDSDNDIIHVNLPFSFLFDASLLKKVNFSDVEKELDIRVIQINEQKEYGLVQRDIDFFGSLTNRVTYINSATYLKYRKTNYRFVNTVIKNMDILDNIDTFQVHDSTIDRFRLIYSSDINSFELVDTNIKNARFLSEIDTNDFLPLYSRGSRQELGLECDLTLSKFRNEMYTMMRDTYRIQQCLCINSTLNTDNTLTLNYLKGSSEWNTYSSGMDNTRSIFSIINLVLVNSCFIGHSCNYIKSIDIKGSSDSSGYSYRNIQNIFGSNFTSVEDANISSINTLQVIDPVYSLPNQITQAWVKHLLDYVIRLSYLTEHQFIFKRDTVYTENTFNVPWYEVEEGGGYEGYTVSRTDDKSYTYSPAIYDLLLSHNCAELFDKTLDTVVNSPYYTSIGIDLMSILKPDFLSILKQGINLSSVISKTKTLRKEDIYWMCNNVDIFPESTDFVSLFSASMTTLFHNLPTDFDQEPAIYSVDEFKTYFEQKNIESVNKKFDDLYTDPELYVSTYLPSDVTYDSILADFKSYLEYTSVGLNVSDVTTNIQKRKESMFFVCIISWAFGHTDTLGQLSEYTFSDTTEVKRFAYGGNTVYDWHPFAGILPETVWKNTGIDLTPTYFTSLQSHIVPLNTSPEFNTRINTSLIQSLFDILIEEQLAKCTKLPDTIEDIIDTYNYVKTKQEYTRIEITNAFKNCVFDSCTFDELRISGTVEGIKLVDCEVKKLVFNNATLVDCAFNVECQEIVGTIETRFIGGSYDIKADTAQFTDLLLRDCALELNLDYVKVTNSFIVSNSRVSQLNVGNTGTRSVIGNIEFSRLIPRDENTDVVRILNTEIPYMTLDSCRISIVTMSGVHMNSLFINDCDISSYMLKGSLVKYIRSNENYVQDYSIISCDVDCISCVKDKSDFFVLRDSIIHSSFDMTQVLCTFFRADNTNKVRYCSVKNSNIENWNINFENDNSVLVLENVIIRDSSLKASNVEKTKALDK